ncbi:putative calcium-binding protein CML22 [Morus notabilis]|uniref:Putative calcium-binding protein CML22 n=1 Tax=Morus notabilis TaxID=981085 RepID=W9RXX2_9ROSA|nr:putative calcium-binding protein CML22 [Morus notabilis]
MKTSSGTSHLCPSLKSLSNKVGGMFCHCGSPNKYKRLDTKLEKKLVEVKRGSQGVGNFKSINSIIMKFPQFREELKRIRSVFEQYDEDSNGAIDRVELKNSLQQLQLQLSEEEVDDLFHSCDIDGSEGIQFNEFIMSKMGSPQLEATFDTIIEVFLFLDKNGDGKLNKKDMVRALNDSNTSERSPAHITRSRFREMDWDRNGHVSFREFLFAFIHWVGIETDEEMPVTGSYHE